MEFKLLKTFETVASLMSFGRAAEVLHVTQSTVSAQIQQLEDDLGTPVFERLGRRILLTPAGEKLLLHTRRMLEYEKSVYSVVRGDTAVAGTISIRIPQSTAFLYLPEILFRFCRLYPNVGFDISNCGYFNLTDELRDGRIDVAFLLCDNVDLAEVSSQKLCSETLVYLTHRKSPLAQKKALTIVDLHGQTLLLPKHDCGYRMSLEQTLREAAVDVAAIIEMNSLSAILQCLATGLGVALLPQKIAQSTLGSNRLIALDWCHPLETGLHLICHKRRVLSGAPAAFVDTVESYFKDMPAQ
ncbi:MAG: LysR family transcriptional regulator [Deltaproteobacteria bacterium]|nr:LysR family transcriptional regulator [Deltaproteobacteria bacterium]